MSANTDHDIDPNVPQACREAQLMIAKFVRSRLSRDEDRGFRSHLMSCEECAGIYRATLASAARLGRTVREDRNELDRFVDLGQHYVRDGDPCHEEQHREDAAKDEGVNEPAIRGAVDGCFGPKEGAESGDQNGDRQRG